MREYLKEYRERSKMTHLDMAKKLNMSRPNYTNIENGERLSDMGLSVMQKLSKIFKVSLQTIVSCEAKYQENKSKSDTPS